MERSVSRTPRLPRRARRTLLGIAALVLVAPAALLAHTTLERSAPAEDEVVNEPLEQLRLVFSQGVEPTLTWAALLAPDGDTIALPRPEAVEGTDNAEYTFAVPPLREPGAYRVAWRTTASDGHVISGSFAFTLTAAAVAQEEPPSIGQAPPPAPRPPPPPTGPYDARSLFATVARWLLFLGLIAAFGAIAFRLAVMPRGRVSPGAASAMELALARMLGSAATVLVFALAIRLWLQVGAVFGPEDMLAAGTVADFVVVTAWGRGWLTQATGLVLLVGCAALATRHAAAWWLAVAAAVALAFGTAMTGHAAADGSAVTLTTDAVHILAAGTWLGTLASLLLAAGPSTWRISTEGRAQRVAALVNAFSPIALAAAGITAATGVLSAVWQLPDLAQLWNSEWGRTLVLKIGLVVIAVGAGFFNWRWVRPSLAREEGVATLRRSAGLELVFGTIVLLITAVLVATPTPQ